MRFATPLAALAVLVAACTPIPPGPRDGRDSVRAAGDSVMVPEAPHLPPDRIAAGTLDLDGPARFEQITVGQAGLLRATTERQRVAAERALSSGMYLGDPYRVLRLSPEPGRDAGAEVESEIPVGTPITGELVVRIDGSGAPPRLRFEHAPDQPFEDGPGGRRAPSAVGLELLPSADGAGYDRARLLLGDGRGWSEQVPVALPRRDWRRLAHRVGVAIEPDGVTLVLDGAAVLEADTYVVGPPGEPRLSAHAEAAGTADVLILSWTSEVEIGD